MILEALAAGIPHGEVLQMVWRRFPRAQTTLKSVQSYASMLRREARGGVSLRLPNGLIKEAIRAGLADPEVLDYARLVVPNAKTRLVSIASTRSLMRRNDPTIPTSSQALRLRGLA